MSVLLLGAEYYGTLAAARCYGRNGIDVVMADGSRRARGLYSRHVKTRLEHPPLRDPERLVDWLVAYGVKNPGTVLYPSNDHLAWLYAAHRGQLSKAFAMYGPDEDVLLTLLDKTRLHRVCRTIGIDVPETHALDGDLTRVRWPALVKPRTQVFLESGVKGFIAESSKDLARGIARFHQLVRHGEALRRSHPEMLEPIVQEYVRSAETNIVSIAGFATRSGRVVSRAAVKVLQRPRKVGIGLCFEGRPVERAVVDAVATLCRRVGYYGCFEAELIADGNRRLLIDFNPRYYSQMGFEIARGLELPMLVWHAARGEEREVEALLDRAALWKPTGQEAYCHKTMLDLVLWLQGLSGKMSRGDVERWRLWHANRGADVVDAVREADDRWPAIVDAARWVEHFARHPRSFVRGFVFNQ